MAAVFDLDLETEEGSEGEGEGEGEPELSSAVSAPPWRYWILEPILSPSRSWSGGSARPERAPTLCRPRSFSDPGLY